MAELVQPQLFLTGDGSSTLFHPEIGDTYHSAHGAWAESQHVFVEAGFSALSVRNCRILEIGFGTGLNALLTARAAVKERRYVEYQGIEPYPISDALLKELNYGELVDAQLAPLWREICACGWGDPIRLHQYFRLSKLQQLSQAEIGADLIYYDAFGPAKQAVMWELAALRLVDKYLKPGGRLVTYCAQGQFKRNLKTLGYDIERLPGCPPKREMTRATKPLSLPD